MALIKCPECGKEISDKALACPKCGCPIGAIINSEIEEFIKEERVHMAEEMKIERKEYAPIELFCTAHYTDSDNKNVSVNFKMLEREAIKKQLNLHKTIKIKVSDNIREVIVDSIKVLDSRLDSRFNIEYPCFENTIVEFPWGEESVFRRFKAIPVEITDKEYSALRFEALVNQMRSINENVKSSVRNLSVIKGIMIFTLIAAIFAGIISACSVLSTL